MCNVLLWVSVVFESCNGVKSSVNLNLDDHEVLEMLVLIACIVQWISSGSHRCCISKSTCRILCVVVRSCEEFFLGVCKVADSMNVFEHFRCSVSLLPSVFSPWHSSGIYLEQLLSLRQLSSYCSPHLCHLDFLNRFWSSLKEYSNPVWLLCRLHFSNSWVIGLEPSCSFSIVHYQL